jgi:O-glycosyl hydrolase
MSRSTRRGRFLTAAVASTVGVGGLIVAVQSPASAASTVSVNGATTFQTIDGFGISEAFNQANSIRNLTGAAQKQALDMLFSPTNGAGFTILRSIIPSDPADTMEPNAPSSPSATPTYVWDGTNDATDEGQLWLAKQAKTYGVTAFYNDAWSAPGFMKTNGNEANGGSLCGTTNATCASGDWRQAYANYLVQHAKNWASAGVTPAFLGFANEPSLTASYSSMLVDPSQAASFLSVLSPTLKASGLPTKATCCDTLGFSLLPSYVSSVNGNATATSDVGAFTSHGYSGAPTTPISGSSGKSVWESEWSVNGSTFDTAWDDGSPSAGFTWAKQIQTAMTGANLNAFLYFWGISNTSHDSSLVGLSGSTLTPTKRFYAMANYSKFIRPGAVRISATSGDGNLGVSAYKNTDGTVAIVVLNSSSSAISASYSVSGAGPATGTVTPFLTNSTSSTAAQPAIALSGGSFSASVPARSLVTYTITGGSSTSPSASPSPSASASPSPSSSPSASPSPSPSASSPSSGTGCTATYSITNAWSGGFQAGVTVANNSSTTALNGWTVKWTLPSGQAITQLWNGTLGVSGSNVTVTNASYNGMIAAGGNTTFGFTASGPSTPSPTLTCTSP